MPWWRFGATWSPPEPAGPGYRPVVLLNRYARAWLIACVVVAAGTIARVVPWPVGAGLVAPLALPAVRRLLCELRPRSLTDRQLAHAWSTSTLATRSRMPAPDRVALTAYRQALLDELLRRRAPGATS